MKALLLSLVAIVAAGWHVSALSAQSCYEIRADGIACPYCAYGIEKNFMKIDGVDHVDFDMKNGLVLVKGDAQLMLSEPQLETLFRDSGFSYREMRKMECNDQDS